MYVPWIHSNAPVPEWWKKLQRWAAEESAGESSWVEALWRKREREQAELDAAIAEMPPLALKTEGWTGYDVDALQPFD